MKGLIEAEPAEAMSVQDFLSRSGPGEYFLSSQEIEDPRLVCVAMVGAYRLYQRRGDVYLRSELSRPWSVGLGARSVHGS
jgi:hypothetical protein